MWGQSLRYLGHHPVIIHLPLSEVSGGWRQDESQGLNSAAQIEAVDNFTIRINAYSKYVANHVKVTFSTVFYIPVESTL